VEDAVWENRKKANALPPPVFSTRPNS